MARTTYVGLSMALAFVAMPLTASTKEPDFPPGLTKRMTLLGEMAYTFGFCAKYIPASSQKDIARMINLEDSRWPAGTDDAKAEVVGLMQNLYMKGLAEKSLPDLSPQSCEKILDDIGAELSAIKD